MPYFCTFHKDHFPQLSLDSATPYREVSTGSREVNSCLTEPPSEKGKAPLDCCLPFLSWCVALQRALRGVGSPRKHWLSHFAEPPGGSNCQSLAATRVPGLPGQGSLAKETEHSWFSSCLPPSPGLGIVLDQVPVWFIRSREPSVLWTVWNRCNY